MKECFERACTTHLMYTQLCCKGKAKNHVTNIYGLNLSFFIQIFFFHKILKTTQDNIIDNYSNKIKKMNKASLFL